MQQQRNGNAEKKKNVNKSWSLSNPPPRGHKDVGSWAFSLFDDSRQEKDRLGLPDRWIENYRLYRGDHWKNSALKNNNRNITINLFFANVERTVANITARNPIAEVVDLNGSVDNSEQILSAKIRKWWERTKQRKKLNVTGKKMEKYGIAIEKAYFDLRIMEPNIAVVDPFAFFPCPGNYEDISTQCPYICQAYPESVEAISAMFDVDINDINESNIYSIFGDEREEVKPKVTSGTAMGSVNAPSNYAMAQHPQALGRIYRKKKALVIECWVRDYTTETNEKGEEVQLYPGGIRVITITNEGGLVLSDTPNPNINPAIPLEVSKASYLFDSFPFYITNSYVDTTNIWGFSAAEQVDGLNKRIDEIFTKMSSFILQSLLPPLIIPKGCGILKTHINNKPGLLLQPDNVIAANSIRFLPVPNLPGTFFKVLDYYFKFFDRIYAIEDVDRGQAPRGVIAASAIVAMQERNAALIQQKIDNIDYMVSQRGRCAVSFYQNFGVSEETLEVNSEPTPFLGVNFSGRQYNYIVESGSTMPKTSLQAIEQAERYYQMGAIDREALLEISKFPKYKEVMERVGEGQLNQALQILIQSGMPKEMAQQLGQQLMQKQAGSNNEAQAVARKPQKREG